MTSPTLDNPPVQIVMIGAAHGTDTSSYSVSGWAGSVKDKDPARVVPATGERVRKTASTILDAHNAVRLGAGDPPGLTPDPTPPRAALTLPAAIGPFRPASDAVLRSL